MSNTFTRLAVGLAGMLALPAMAATLVEYRDGEDEPPTQMWIDGTTARFESPGQPGQYTVFDMKTGKSYGVDSNKRQIVEFDFGGETDEPRQAPDFDIGLEDQGDGPTIAGYPTRHYLLVAEGEICAEYFLSKQAMKDAGLQAFTRALASMVQVDLEDPEPCDVADDQMSERYLDYGLPLREVDAEGELETEIVRIQRNAKLPAGGFSLPATYKRLTMEEFIQQQMNQQKQ